MPNLTAQHPDAFVAAMKAYQAGERSHNMMQMLSSTLSDEKIRSMGVYYALQEPTASQTKAAGDAAAGQAASESCVSCHGFDGNADQASVPSLAGQDPVYLVTAMNSYLVGQRDHAVMQGAMAGASEQDMADMAAWYASQPPQARNVKAPLSTRDWLERCQRCHGEEGNSPDPRYPSLAGQNAPYFISAMNAFASGEKSNRIMLAMSEPLSDSDIERLAKYYQARTPDRVIYLNLPCEKQGEE